MNQEEIDTFMKKIDKKCKFPKYWNDFIIKQSRDYNIIIKDSKNKEFFCTNCNTTFNDSNSKIGNFIECPNCNEEFKVYGSNYTQKSFIKSVVLLQRMDKQIIGRVFEIYSYFEDNNKNIIRDVNEYARIIPGVGTFLGDNTYINMYGVTVIYNYTATSWWKYRRL